MILQFLIGGGRPSLWRAGVRLLFFAGGLIVVGVFVLYGIEHVRHNRVASPERLVEYFEQVVFHSEFGSDKNIYHISKWVKPIRIALFGDEAEAWRSLIYMRADDLANLSGLPFTLLDQPDGTENISIHFVANEDRMKAALSYENDLGSMKEVIPASSCLALGKGTRGTYKDAFIIIPYDSGYAWLTTCILEELTQTLGLPNDSDIIQPSIFNDKGQSRILSINDMILVRTLYDPRIKAGMAKSEAMALAGEIIPELVARVKAEGVEALYQSPGWRVQ